MNRNISFHHIAYICRDVKSMTVSFPIPATEHRYLTKPTR